MKHPNPSGYRGTWGTSAIVIPKTYLKAALILLVTGADRLKQKNVVKQICESQKNKSRKTLENTITRALVREVQKEQDKYSIHTEPHSKNLIHDCEDIEYSEIDIKFIWDDYLPNVYLAVEAKLLYGTRSSLAGDYVEKGVMDFINRKYSWGHDHGIMAGYVLVAPIKKAISSVENALKKRKDETNETSPFDEDKFIDYPLLFNSVHKQENNGREIKILHIFFDFAS